MIVGDQQLSCKQAGRKIIHYVYVNDQQEDVIVIADPH
jgi:hypothetical protein